ncbi:hypothetical protein AB6A40_011170 [Gnathostoma spinigerum]|uniref:Uncharacterized protein n=1 Tax=Gnathostoma spinigerum TaxID=75299 RepID=A0ABD6F2I0_9BILA
MGRCRLSVWEATINLFTTFSISC